MSQTVPDHDAQLPSEEGDAESIAAPAKAETPAMTPVHGISASTAGGINALGILRPEETDAKTSLRYLLATLQRTSAIKIGSPRFNDLPDRNAHVRTLQTIYKTLMRDESLRFLLSRRVPNGLFRLERLLSSNLFTDTAVHGISDVVETFISLPGAVEEFAATQKGAAGQQQGKRTAA